MKINFTIIAIFTLAATLLAEKSTAQCNISITSDSGSCMLPTTLRINADFGLHQIEWFYEGNLVQSYTNVWDSNAITVAGGNGSGTALNQTGHLNDVLLDDTGNLLTTGYYQKRVTKWAPQATTSVVVAEMTSGSFTPGGLAWDKDNLLYIADAEQHRVFKWDIGAPSGTVVAGGNGAGAAANQFNRVGGICIDASNNLYVVDLDNSRVQKWAPGATSGTTVASFASGDFPQRVALDDLGNLYVTEYGKHRVTKFTPGSTVGVVVAGSPTGAGGTTLDRLNRPSGIDVDGLGNLYITDNHRVMMWPEGHTEGIKISGNSQGNAANQFNNPSSLRIDRKSGDLYIADYLNYRAQKLVTSIIDTFEASQPGIYTVVIKAFNGCVITDTIAAYPAIEKPTITIDSLKLGVSGSYDNYQWLLDGNIIPNATDSVYHVVENGHYRVIVNNNGICIDTSDIYTIENIVGLAKIPGLSSQIQIYPNPANDVLYIKSPVNVQVIINSIEGKEIMRVYDQTKITISNLANGVYFLKVADKNGTLIKTEKLIKR